MKVLVACEFSGVVSKAFATLGHEAWSCDILPTTGGRTDHHIIGDVLEYLDDGWDLMVAHPPCTYLSKMGARWAYRDPWRIEAGLEAMAFVRALYDAPIPRIAIENPIGKLSTQWRKPDQIVQPWWFGDGYTKATCLWLKNLPKLEKTRIHPDPVPLVQGTYVKDGVKFAGGKFRKPSLRSRSLPHTAWAMAVQWSGYAEQHRRAVHDPRQADAEPCCAECCACDDARSVSA